MDTPGLAAYHWDNVAIGGGGYVTGLVIHPKERGLVYIRTDVGGCFRWNDRGGRWIPITDHFAYTESDYYDVESIALDPVDPDVVYIAVGSAYRPGTIFKSTDRGETWTSSNLRTPMHGNGDLRWAGERLAVDPCDPRRLLFGSRSEGIFRSTDGGLSWSPARKPGKPDDKIGVLGIVFDPGTEGTVYANVYGDGVYVSTDRGESWTPVPESPSAVLRMSIDREGTLYAAGRKRPKVARRRKGEGWQDITPVKFRMDVSTATSTGMVLASFGFCGICVDPNNPDHLVLGVDYKMPGKMYRSTDSGESWTEVNKRLNKTVPWWQDDYWGGAMAALVIDPHVPGQVWFTDWFGVWRTEDVTTEVPTWTVLGAGLEEVYIQCLVAPPAAPASTGYMVLSGANDICGLVHYDLRRFPNHKHRPIYQHTWDIDYCASDPCHIVRIGQNTALNFHGDYVVSTEKSTFGGAVSADQGRTWTNFPTMPIIDEAPVAVAMSASDPELIIMVCLKAAFRTEDGGRSWHPVDLPTGKRGKLLASDRIDGRKFYYYHEGTICRSTDGGKTFQATAASLPREDDVPSRKRSSIQLKTMPGREGEVWTALGDEGLFRSSDSGTSSTRVSGVDRTLLFAFGRPFAGTTEPILFVYGTVQKRDGVFRSLDLGTTWQDISPGNKVGIGCNPSVMEGSKQHPGLVFIGTLGRGLFYGMPNNCSAAG
jgi:photosystem II stability/assembly factor-like uncharacterized protein